MKYIIAYDITNDRKRDRTAKKLEGVGVRLQYSVFECELKLPELRRLKKQIEKIINPKVDSVIYFRICGNCSSARLTSGVERILLMSDSVVV